MRRSNKKIIDQLKSAQTEVKKKSPLKLSLDILDKLTSDMPYDKNQVEVVAHFLARQHGLEESDVHVLSEKNLPELGKILTEYASKNNVEKHAFCILEISKCWKALAYSRSSATILYKDPSGEDVSIPTLVKDILCEVLPAGFTCVVNSEGTCDPNDSGVLTLNYMERVMTGFLSHNKEKFISEFPLLRLPFGDEIGRQKTDLKVDILRLHIEQILRGVHVSAEDQLGLQKAFELCKNARKKLQATVATYEEILKREVEKFEDNPQYQMDKETILKAQKELTGNFDQTCVKEMKKIMNEVIPELQLSSHESDERCPSLEKEEASENGHENIKMGEKSPVQIFQTIIKLVRGTEKTKKLESLLTSVSMKFGVDKDELLEYFKAKPKATPVKVIGDVSADDSQNRLRELAGQLPKMSEIPLKPASTQIKNMSQLLAELAVEKEMETADTGGKDTEEFFRQKYAANTAVVAIENEFQIVMGHFERWKDADIPRINIWATRNKGRLVSHLEGIAVMNRVFQLTTGGYRLRSPQILSVIWFLKDSQGEGKLAQISTGEGKTVIIAILASLKILLGTETVDVFTSNEVLAAEGAEEMRTFYSVLGISVAANNPDKLEKVKKVVSSEVKQKPCYAADVVYGTITNFQFDYLRQISEGAEVRGKRGFNFVILDEVDNLSVDNGGNIAKLAKPYPGMESLKYVYIKIWQELAKAEDVVLNDFKEKLEQKEKELDSMEVSAELAGGNLSEEPTFDQKSSAKFEAFRVELVSGYIDDIKANVKKSNCCELEVIHGHLRPYCTSMIDKWIDNALYAKLECRENEHYVIRKGKDGEELVIPVDYANTGVTMQNTQWSEGLHQFVQLKHNLRITCESLTSSFISNMGYVKLYEGRNICGLTGTLGSVAEREMLSSAYHVIFQVIPRYKKYNLQMCEGYVVEDEHWANLVALWAFIWAVRRNRSVLVICRTISELETVRKNVKSCLELEMQEEERHIVKVKIYADEDGSNVVKEKVGQREIIIATNIAGRGTNFKTTKELEASGGLHVVVSFLPINQRVQDQAFGRTARQGHRGTGQLILKRSDVVDIGIDFEEWKELKMEEILERRDFMEKARLKEVKRKKAKEIIFKDGLFKKFSELSRVFKGKKESEVGGSYVYADLCEFWAFWLHKQNLSFEYIKTTSVEKEFERFERDSSELVNEGKVICNPFNEIRRADKLIKAEMLDEAEKAVRRGIEMCGERGLCSSAYFKLFEIEIEKGAQFSERFKKAVASLIFIPVKKDEKYKQNAKAALENAMKGLEYETKYFRKNFIEKDTNKDFQRILVKNESDGKNLMLDHLNARITALNTFYEHAKSLIEKLTESVDCETIGLAMGSRIPHYLKKLDENKEAEKSLKESLRGEELDELQSVGLTIIYSLRDVHDAHKETIIGAQIQIGSGLACLACGIFFPPSLPIMGPIAGALISEGVCDIVIELLSRGNSGFDVGSYVKGKCISFGIALATMGISAVASSVKMMQAASKACKSLAKLLRKCKKFKGACEKIAKQLDKLSVYFDKLKVLAEFRKLKDVEKLQMLKKLKAAGDFEKLKNLGGLERLKQLEKLKSMGKLDVISKVELLKSMSLRIGRETVQSTAISAISVHLVASKLDKVMEGLKPKIQGIVRDGINGEERVKQNLSRLKSREELDSLVNTVLNETYGEMAGDVLKDIALGLAKNIGNWKLKLASVLVDTVISGVKISRYISSFCEKFNEAVKIKLQNNEETGENETSTGTLEEKVEVVVSLLTDKLYNQIVQLVGKYANTFVVGPLVKTVMGAISSVEKKDEKGENDGENSMLADFTEAYEILGLKPGATKSEIKKAYREAAKRFHPDRPGGDTEEFKKVNDAFELLKKHCEGVKSGESHGATLLLTGPKSNINLQNTLENLGSSLDSRASGVDLQPADGGNILTLSSTYKQCIIVKTADQQGGLVNVKEFGSKYKENGNSVAVIGYLPPSDRGVGHFFAVSNDNEEGWKDALSATATETNEANNNCLYESLAGQIGGGLMTPHQLREVGEKWSLANVKYSVGTSTSKLLNNPITRSLFIRAQHALLVGGSLQEARDFRDSFVSALQQMNLAAPETEEISLGEACRNDKNALDAIKKHSTGFLGYTQQYPLESKLVKYRISGIDTLTRFVLEFKHDTANPKPFVLEYPSGMISVVAGDLYSLVSYDGQKQDKVHVAASQYKGTGLGSLSQALYNLTHKDARTKVEDYPEVSGRIICESLRNKATFVIACLAMTLNPTTMLTGSDLSDKNLPVTSPTGSIWEESEVLQGNNPTFLLSLHRKEYLRNKNIRKYFEGLHRNITDVEARKPYESELYIKIYEYLKFALDQGERPTLTKWD